MSDKIELVECPACDGAGQHIFSGEDCIECAGKGFIPVLTDIDFNDENH